MLERPIVMMIASSVPLYFQACLSLSLEWLCVFCGMGYGLP
jgi:hypothetical protein